MFFVFKKYVSFLFMLFLQGFEEKKQRFTFINAWFLLPYEIMKFNYDKKLIHYLK